MAIFYAMRQNLSPWPSLQSLSKNAFNPLSIKLASWEIYAPALYRSNTTSAATPLAAAKRFLHSNTARITKSVLRGTAKAPASLSVRKTSTRFNSNWKTIGSFATLSMSGLPCRRSCPACASATSAKHRRMKSSAKKHEFPSDRVRNAAHSRSPIVRGTPANKGPNQFRDRN